MKNWIWTKNIVIINNNLTVLLEHKEALEGLDKSIECVINDNDELQKEIKGSLEYTESIVLYKFSDDICRFQEFWLQYGAAIHENENLQDIEKFNYLKSLLTDSVATVISGIPLTPENYRKAVEILKDRFGKKEILISAHTNRLLNLEPDRNTNDIFALRKLYDETNV
ncbi:reverse transcriptase [Caerostris extrusa]|uniref:Reverse transcriptase n=1 Tax=Caerostris extrusa TaxID=172846 RepID=A0AAV4NCE1_CAEEX|nr:reverse transcriptase [Caerostris extrusa]